MKTTFLKAKEIAKTGNMDKAWEVAKQDEGLNEGVTKEQWIEWMHDLLPQSMKTENRGSPS